MIVQDGRMAGWGGTEPVDESAKHHLHSLIRIYTPPPSTFLPPGRLHLDWVNLQQRQQDDKCRCTVVFHGSYNLKQIHFLDEISQERPSKDFIALLPPVHRRYCFQGQP